LRTDGFVRSSGRRLELTPKGKDAAESVVRKHRLAERLLADVIGLEWHKVHLEAGRWEHVISDEVEARLVVLLDNPATCPHGNPIPGSGVPRPTGHHRLSSVAIGGHVRVERVTETVELDAPTLVYLDEHALRPGATAELRAKSPDGTLMLETANGAVALSAALAEQLYVSALSPVAH
jgi:DtxR family Mn-dependent transcriptional regulator